MKNTVNIQLTNAKRRNGLQRPGFLPVVIIALTAYAAIYHFYMVQSGLNPILESTQLPGTF